MNYTNNQVEAIQTIDSNLQIIACAGSGKTQVISQRIVNILRDKAGDGIGPQNIVAFTFTEKAAGELKDRIHRLCIEQLGSDVGLAEMYVGTIHGFCLDLLQTYENRYLKYSVLSDIQQRLLIDRYSQESGLTDLVTTTGARLKRWVDSRVYQKTLSIVREAEIDEDILGDHPIQQALAKYSNLLDRKRFLDFSTQLTEAVRSLQTNESVRQKMAERVKFLIVDEYQDVNPLQEKIISLLHTCGAQVCVVGDDDQTIYQWNGSDIGNILSFNHRYPDVVQVQMGENFRSSPAIVNSARKIAEKNEDRLDKIMVSQGMQDHEEGDLLALRFQSPQEEAAWIARKIQQMRGRPFIEDGETRGLTWSDCAILLRSVKNSADPFVEALREAGIPYLIKGMTRLFDTREVKAACAIFQYLSDGIGREDLKQSWLDAHLGLEDGDLERAIDWLDAERADWPNRWLTSERSLQHTFIGFLEQASLREESIAAGDLLGRSRGEIVYYNLGKFSQIITDYELIHFHSEATSLYKGFAGFLQHQAPDYYPEGWEGAGYARPDAVQIMTVHQSKGLEYPVVFVPALVSNRFPAKRGGGRQWYHVIPEDAVIGAERYRGSIEDERRLFYVALTRSKKYLFCSWAPEEKRLYKKPSIFFDEFSRTGCALTSDPRVTAPMPIEPRQKDEKMEVALSFSELKYFFECPYQFKLRFLYGFNPGYNERLGYGKSLHDALAEIHRRVLDGEKVDQTAIPALLDQHLHLPFAWDELVMDMRAKAEKALGQYFAENSDKLDKVEHVEKTIELKLADGVVVNGRVDLIRRTDTNQIVVIDFKSTDRAQEEEVTRDQLNIYALGYRQLTGQSADLIEIYNLDGSLGSTVRELVDPDLLAQTEERVVAAGQAIRDGALCRPQRCGGCDLQGICRGDIHP